MESQPPLVKSWHTIRIWIGKMIQSNNESEHLRQKCILGIDPGTNVMGYGLLQVSGNKASLLVMGVIDMRKSSDPYLRLGHIFERVQGIIDAYFVEDGRIVIVDYKTDRANDAKELIDRYQVQLDFYEKAVNKTNENKVKEKVIYAFALKTGIALN